LICGDREREMLGRYEENAYMWRMLKLTGHPAAYLYEWTDSIMVQCRAPRTIFYWNIFVIGSLKSTLIIGEMGLAYKHIQSYNNVREIYNYVINT
jgi:hypothetical protein